MLVSYSFSIFVFFSVQPYSFTGHSPDLMEMVPHGFYGWWLEKNPWLPISDVINIKIEVFRDHKEWEGIPAKDAHSKLLIHTHPSLCRRDGGFQSYRQVEHLKVIQGAPCITVLLVSLKDLFRICPLHYYYFSLLLSSSQSSLLSPYLLLFFSHF